MKFSLVHPSRSRVVRAGAAIEEWTGAASGRHAVEHILSVDSDDADVDAYRALAARHGSRLVIHPNRRMVDAMNRGAQAATGDVLVAMSDDFGCPKNWDEQLAHVIGGRTEAAVLVDDGINARVLTLPVLTRALYARLGYVYHPAYISMFADDDLTELTRRAGVLIEARQLLFPHRHCFVALSEMDETYRRQNSNRSWWHGWRTFEKRKLEGFGFARRGPAVRAAQLRVDLYYFLRVGGSRAFRLWRAASAGSPRL